MPLTKAELKAEQKRNAKREKRKEAIKKAQSEIVEDESNAAKARELELKRILKEQRNAAILLAKIAASEAAANVRAENFIKEALETIAAFAFDFDNKSMSMKAFAYLMKINPEIKAKISTLLMSWKCVCPNFDADPLMLEYMLIENADLYIPDLYEKQKSCSFAVVSIINEFPVLDTRSESLINNDATFYIVQNNSVFKCDHRSATEAMDAGAMHFGDPFPFFNYSALDAEAVREVIENFGALYRSH
jgi:hypothetical protein